MKSTCYFTTLVIYLLLLTILNINRVTAVPLVEPDVEEALNQTDRIKVNIVFVKNITPEDFVASLNLSSEHFKIIYITYSRTAAQAIVSRVGFEELKKRDDLLGIGMPKLFELTNEAILKELNKSGSVLVEILLNENISQNEVIVDLQSMDNGFNMIQKRYSPRSIVANITAEGLEKLSADGRVSRIDVIRSTNLHLAESKQTSGLLLSVIIWLFIIFVLVMVIWLFIKEINRRKNK